MDTFEAITTRRSVRRFKPDPIDPALIEKLMTAAMHAPSAHNEQPWHFIVIDDRKILNEIPNLHPYSKMLLEAPMAICVCADLELDKTPGCDYWIQDCAAATENIMLTATAEGLGSCWIGFRRQEEYIDKLRTMLNLPESVVPFNLIALGHLQEPSKQPTGRYKENRVHKNQW